MIAYDKRLEERYKREEVYDISQRELIPWEINGQKYNVYGNVNLSIFTTDECNAKCDFCVAELRYLNDGQEYVKPKLCNTNAYLNRLDTILEAVMPLNPSVSITGGEPSLDPKLSEILKVLASHNVRKRTMTTNGAGLLKTIGIQIEQYSTV